MRIFYCLFFLILFKTNSGITKDSVAIFKSLEIRSLNDIMMADTTVIYDYIHVYEHDSLIQGIEKLSKLHTIEFKYEGNIRRVFPKFSKTITEITKMEISGINLQQVPSIAHYDSLVFLMIEARNYAIDFKLSSCLKLKTLYLTCKNTYNYVEEICQLKNLRSLGIGEHSKRVLPALGCLKHLNKLESLSISIDKNSLKELAVFEKLKTIGISNKLSYKDVIAHLTLFETYDKISFENFTGTQQESNDLKKKLKGFGWNSRY